MRPGRPRRVRNVEREARSVTKALWSTGRGIYLPPSCRVRKRVGTMAWQASVPGRSMHSGVRSTAGWENAVERGDAECEARLNT